MTACNFRQSFSISITASGSIDDESCDFGRGTWFATLGRDGYEAKADGRDRRTAYSVFPPFFPFFTPILRVFAASDQVSRIVWNGFAPLSCGVDGCAHISLGLGGPHGAVAVGNFSLDHAGPQLSLRAVVGGLDLAGIIAKDQKLILRPPDFGLQLACEVAFCRCGKKGGELLFKLALFAGDCRGGETGDISGQIEGLAKPQLEPQGQIVRSMLQRIGRVARQCAKQV